jgi:hypothetical protein
VFPPRPISALQCQHTRSVRQEAIVATRASASSLIEQLHVARIHGHGLVGVASHDIAVADVVGPRSAAIGLAREGRTLAGCLRCPRTAQTCGCIGAEVAAAGPNRLDNHQVFVLALHGVDLHGFEQVVGRVAHDHGRRRAEITWEVADGHAGAVDLAVVTGKEQVHVRGVANEGLVDGAGARAGDTAAEERLRAGPAICIGGIAGRLVGEGGGSPLVSQHPDALRREIEEGRRHGARAHAVLASRGHVRPVREEAEVHRAIARSRVMRRPIDEMLAVVHDAGEVLERHPSGLGVGQRARRGPAVRRRQRALCLDCGCEQYDASRNQGGGVLYQSHGHAFFSQMKLKVEVEAEGGSWDRRRPDLYILGDGDKITDTIAPQRICASRVVVG